MKKISYLLIIIIPLLSQCGKQKKNEPLASNFFQQASLEAQHGYHKKALNLINKSIEYQNSHKSLLLKATLLYSIKEFDESVTLFKKIINDKKTPENMKADARNNLASVLYALGDTDEAEKIWLELGCNKDYLSPELSYFNLGIVEFRKMLDQTVDTPEYHRHLNQAERYLHQALSVSKDYPDALFYIAQIHIRRGDLQKAHKILLDIVIDTPDHTIAKDLLYQIEKQINNWQE